MSVIGKNPRGLDTAPALIEDPPGPGECGVCRSSLSGARLTACGTCRTFYHPDCWEWYGRRCSTYGCGTVEGGNAPAPRGSIALSDLQPRADAFIKQRGYEEAIGLLTMLLECAPRNAAALASRGLARWRRKRIDEAESDFRAALRVRPDDLETRLNLSFLLLRGGGRAGDDEEGLRLLKHCIRYAPAGWPLLAKARRRLLGFRIGTAVFKVVAFVAWLVVHGILWACC